MGLRILHDSTGGHAALYCSTTDWAFGPVFYETVDSTAEDQAECFIHWLPQDARRYSDTELERKYAEWLGLPKCWEHGRVEPCERCREVNEVLGEEEEAR